MAGSGSNGFAAVLGAALTAGATYIGMSRQNVRQSREEWEKELRRIKGIYQKAVDYIDDDALLKARISHRHIFPRERRRQRQAREKHLRKGVKILSRLELEDNEKLAEQFSNYQANPSYETGRIFKQAVRAELRNLRESHIRARRRRMLTTVVIVLVVFLIAFSAYAAWAEIRHQWPFAATGPKPVAVSTVHTEGKTRNNSNEYPRPVVKDREDLQRQAVSKVGHQVKVDKPQPTESVCIACIQGNRPSERGLVHGLDQTLNGVQSVVSNLVDGVQQTLNNIPILSSGINSSISLLLAPS
jgi:hypothetical protein